MNNCKINAALSSTRSRFDPGQKWRQLTKVFLGHTCSSLKNAVLNTFRLEVALSTLCEVPWNTRNVGSLPGSLTRCGVLNQIHIPSNQVGQERWNTQRENSYRMSTFQRCMFTVCSLVSL